MDVLDPVVGDPVGVSTTGRTLESIALDVERLAIRLRALAGGGDEWSGTAASSARARSATVPPKLDKAQVSYAAAGSALSSYARSLADAQQQSAVALAAAGRAQGDLEAARAAQAAAATRDAASAAAARAAGVAVPPATAPRFDGSIEDANARLTRARALNDQAHEQQSQAAKVAAAALQQASRVGIHNASWLHRVTDAVGHWASTRWSSALRDVAKVANVVSALAGLGALVLAVAGVFFPPLEAAAAVLETVSLVSAVVAGAADTALAVTGRASWSAAGVDALTLAPAGLGKVVTKAAPLIRESRVITPTTVVHASAGDAGSAIRESHDSGLAYPGGLGANDALGGHVLTHVGVRNDDLAARGLPRASSFTDRATAEYALAEVQSASAGEIRTWLADANKEPRLTFAATFGDPVGRVLYRGRSEPVDAATVIAVLHAEPSAPLGYFIVTGFVAP